MLDNIKEYILNIMSGRQVLIMPSTLNKRLSRGQRNLPNPTGDVPAITNPLGQYDTHQPFFQGLTIRFPFSFTVYSNTFILVLNKNHYHWIEKLGKNC